MENRTKKHDVWYNLDNAANIFPAISDDKNTNVFRISCELKQTVDREALQEALDAAIREFDHFRVIMRRGLFWFYLERTDRAPVVQPENERPCNRLFYASRKDLLFAVSYYSRRISIEVFHSVSDGGGTLQLLKAMLYHYIRIVHGKKLPLPNQSPPAQRAEDSFLHHYDPNQKKPPTQKSAYTIGGTALPPGSIRVISGDVKTGEMLALAKSKGATVTAYLAALFICAIYAEMTPARVRGKSIGVNIPVDLRNHFPSESARNFFSVTEISYNFYGGAPDFDAALAAVSEQMAEKLKPEELAGRMNYTMGVQKNIFARAVPLVLKNIVLKGAYARSEHVTTCALSNVGRITLPESYEPYVESFSCLLNPTPIHKIKACVCSYGDHFMINFTSCIAESKVEKYFFRSLAASGVEVCVTSNGEDSDEIL